ncbi:MAG: hypothetical protein WCJ92_02670 [Alphaproteobacteria bacterium]
MKIPKILGLALLTASAFTSVNAMTDPADARFNGKTPYQLKQIASDALNAAVGHIPAPAYVASTLTAASQLKTYIESVHVNDFAALFAQTKVEQIARINLVLNDILANDLHDFFDDACNITGAVGDDGVAFAVGFHKPVSKHLGDVKTAIAATINDAAFDIAATGVVVPVGANLSRIKDMNLLNDALVMSINTRLAAFLDLVLPAAANIIDGRNAANCNGAQIGADVADVRPGGLSKAQLKASFTAVISNYK